MTDAASSPPVSSPASGSPSESTSVSPLEDPLVLDEIELYGELVIAASGSEEPLSQDRIDKVLGVARDGTLP